MFILLAHLVNLGILGLGGPSSRMERSEDTDPLAGWWPQRRAARRRMREARGKGVAKKGAGGDRRGTNRRRKGDWTHHQAWSEVWLPTMLEEALKVLGPKGPRGLADDVLEGIGIKAFSAAQARIGQAIILPGPWAWKRKWREALLRAHQQRLWGGLPPSDCTSEGTHID